jgi:aminomethyltransferase
MFDVSHMTIVDVSGTDATDWLRKLLANDVARLTEAGKGLYSCMLNPAGGVIDDLIVYKGRADAYRMVVNAGTRDVDLAWMTRQAADYDVALHERTEVTMIAVQGPQAVALAAPVLPNNLGDAATALSSFCAVEDGDVYIARTGYTGEDGWEIMLPAEQGNTLWDNLLDMGVKPCGLGARDTLRLEAGLNLYGQDMTASTSPLESNLGWTIAWEPADRNFIGRHALEQQRATGVQSKLVGLVLEGRGVMRHGQRVVSDAGVGEVASGGFSPTMQRSIALARMPAALGDSCQVEIRNDLRNARVVKPPFVRQGQIKIDCGG